MLPHFNFCGVKQFICSRLGQKALTGLFGLLLLLRNIHKMERSEFLSLCLSCSSLHKLFHRSSQPFPTSPLLESSLLPSLPPSLPRLSHSSLLLSFNFPTKLSFHMTSPGRRAPCFCLNTPMSFTLLQQARSPCVLSHASPTGEVQCRVLTQT